MSTPRECIIAATSPTTWYLMVAAQEHGKIEDPFTTCDGPFPNEEKADEYIHLNYSNPGGVWVIGSPEDLTPRMKKLIEVAKRPTYNTRFW